MYQPWVARLFPGLTLSELLAGNWTVRAYVGMAELARSGG